MAVMRYMVDDVGQAIAFYGTHFGFSVEPDLGPAFASLRRDDLTLWLAGPESSAGRPMPDGVKPVAGGWNRLVVEVDDIGATVRRLSDAGVEFRNEIVRGPGGAQILARDPAGNVIELFQPAS
ncbi:MAG: VOC family protein [Dehalococcoidia bacterium]|nr:VOC family protein [Dehalococcoidia bacterium]